MGEVATVKHCLNELVDFSLKHKCLLCAHTANFLVDALYTTLIPLRIRNAMESLSDSEILAFPVEVINGTSQRSDVLDMDTARLRNAIPVFKRMSTNLQTSFDRAQMSEKKFHEVIAMGEFLKINQHQRANVVDLGSGKGYLSDFLSQFHSFNVVGVETCSSFNESAAKRNLKVSRIWRKMMAEKSIDVNTEKTSNHLDKSDGYSGKNERNVDMEERLRLEFNASLTAKSYKIKTEHITSGTDLSDIFPGECFALVGLHTCGDLAANSLRLFLKSEKCRFICNVGCCYNTLTEQYDEAGFPLSGFLRSNLQEEFGSMKSLACLSPEKQMDGNAKNPLNKLFNRALLQKLVFEKTGERLNHLQQFSKNKAGKSFLEYYKFCFPIVDCENKEVLLQLSDSEIGEFERNHLLYKHQLQLFNQYRACFSLALEYVFLLDRLLFLKENGIENCEIVQLFDPRLSPRCYALVASKDNQLIFSDQ
ncbi:putative methyltransferase-like protein 25 [Convolutriloba macropyga]|uniref:putative methyltransferase-like protein 25 n=1 Tax=Convolutriloba macropyga TaxID=536237 RepID=UPI003F528FC5